MFQSSQVTQVASWAAMKASKLLVRRHNLAPVRMEILLKDIVGESTLILLWAAQFSLVIRVLHCWAHGTLVVKQSGVTSLCSLVGVQKRARVPMVLESLAAGNDLRNVAASVRHNTIFDRILIADLHRTESAALLSY